MSGSNPTNQVSYAIGIDSQSYPLLRDATGALIVTGSGSGGSSNVNLVSVSGTPFLLGQHTMAGSLSVALASDQSTIPVSGTVTANQGTSPWITSISTALPAGTNVIGHVITDTGSTTSVSNFPATQSVTQGTSPWVVSGTISGSGNFTVVQPTGTNLHMVLDSGTLTSITNALPAGTNVIGHVIADSGSTTVVTGNVTVVQPTGSNLHVAVDSMPTTTVTGTVAATQSGTWTVQPGNTANTTPWLATINQGGNSAVVTGANALKVDGSAVTQPVSGSVSLTTATSGGWTPSLQNALSTTVKAVKSSAAGNLGGYYVFNPNSSVEYVQIFDVATAGGVTLGTTTPKLSIGIPALGAANLSIPAGITFANGIQVAATTTATGSSAPSVAVDANFWFA